MSMTIVHRYRFFPCVISHTVAMQTWPAAQLGCFDRVLQTGMRSKGRSVQVARIVLDPLITNIQASWVKMGPQWASKLLAAGANDMGGSIMNESITK